MAFLNVPSWKELKCPIHSRTEKLIYLFSGILFSDKKKCLKYWYIWQNCYLEWRKQDRTIHIQIWRTGKTLMTEVRIGNLGRWVWTGKGCDGTFWVMEMFLSWSEWWSLSVYMDTCNLWICMLKVCAFYLSFGNIL